jgi:hypothetical protein
MDKPLAIARELPKFSVLYDLSRSPLDLLQIQWMNDNRERSMQICS